MNRDIEIGALHLELGESVGDGQMTAQDMDLEKKW